MSTHLFTEPTQRWARADAGGEVHLFRVDHAAPDPRLGALHTVDVPLVFGTFGSSEVARHYVADDERTRAVSEQVQRDWGRFVHGEDLGWGAETPTVIGG